MSGSLPAPSRPVRPGALTALLDELARAPAGSAGWELPLVPGEWIGRFEIVREIGRGGFGVVYEAHDAELGRAVALKAIRAVGTHALRELRLLGEAEAAARLAHPNIVHLYDVGRCDRGPFLIMELLHGETLDDRLARGALPAKEAVRIAVEIARGLAYAHEQGVVHRDLKPGNVFLCADGQVKVLDFGLAHVFGRGGVRGGTPGYMAPEQASGEPGDERSDVFALGVIVHELVTGRRPSEAGGLESERARRLPRHLWKLVGRMLATDPALRPADGRDVHEALASIQRSSDRRRAVIAWALAAASLLSTAAVAVWPRSPLLPPGRLVVALADASNATGDRDLDEVSTLLGTALEQSRRFSVVARSRLVALLRQPDGTAPGRIDEPAATNAARRAHANALFVPAVRHAGDGFDVEVRAVDLTRDEPLFTVRERAAGKRAVAFALDRLSQRVRRELHEDPKDAPERPVLLAQIVPENPEALRHYVDGKRLASERRGREAAEAYERAVAADPDFSLAHAELAEGTAFFDAAATVRHLEAAMRGADRLPPKERTLLEARSAMLQARADDALARWDQAIASWPQDPTAYAQAGLMVLFLLSDPAAARPYLEKALALGGLERADALDALILLDRLDEALALARRWVSESPGAESFVYLSAVHRLRGERQPALDAARQVVSFDRLPGSTLGGDRRSPVAFWSFVDADALGEVEELYRARGLRSWEALALRGRLHAALAALDDDARSGSTALGGDVPGAPPAARAVYHNVRGNLVWGFGNPDLVWREVEEQLRLGSGAAQCSAGLLASLGDLERAERLLSLWMGVADPRTPCERVPRHLGEWKKGDPDSAARGLAGMYGPEPAYYLGVVLAGLGRDREAVDTFRRFRRDPAFNYDGANVVAYPRSLYLEAAALERLGDRDEALRAVDRLLRLWKDAEPDMPYLREAKALRNRLLAEQARGPRGR